MNDYDKFSFLITYPMLLLCLVPVTDETARFHEEYLFSQLFAHVMYMNKKKISILMVFAILLCVTRKVLTM